MAVSLSVNRPLLRLHHKQPSSPVGVAPQLHFHRQPKLAGIRCSSSPSHFTDRTPISIKPNTSHLNHDRLVCRFHASQFGEREEREVQMHSYRWCGSLPSTATTTTATTMIRRLCCLQSVSPSLPFSSAPTTIKKPLVLLGAPQVSAIVLDMLLNASASPHSLFEVAAIVTQPPARRDRGKKLALSPLATHALDRGFSPDLIFTPLKAGDDDFLSNLKALQPHLCITAAYGNILPTKFLDIPPLGTVNIHPSLLPLYRGAAPVQRALQDGVKETGVSLAFTVRALDAGPIIATETMQVDDQIKAPDLLELLFHKGSELLIRELPSILDGSARLKAQPQDDSKATLAPKITSDESWLSFDEEAYVLHNKVRAFSGWPGTRARVLVIEKNGEQKTLDIKIITTRLSSHESVQFKEVDDVAFVEGVLVFPCGRGTTIEVLELQLPGKKAVNAAAFWNGLRGQKLKKL